MMTAFLCLSILIAAPPEPLEIPAGRRQLFLDDYVVSELQGLKRTLHSPRKLGAVIRGATPDEVIQIRTAPVWDVEAKLFKLWVLGSKRQLWTSEDGLHWQPGPSPNLRTDHVVYDPHDPDPARRFKAAQTNDYFAVSPDGVTWTKVPVEKVPSSDESNLSYDPAERLFIHTVKRGGQFGRAVAVAVSRDFVKWDDYGLVFGSDEEDQRRGPDVIRRRVADQNLMPLFFVDEKVFRVEVYNMGVFHYEGQYIGLPAMYHATGPVPNYPNTDGYQVIQLAVSRDLKTWHRVADRAVFIDHSPLHAGAYDLTQILPPSAPIIRGDELWFYYTGLKYRSTFIYEGTYPNGTHIDKPGLDPDRGAVCLAVLRRDGFVSLDPIEEEGVLLTKAFRLTGDKVSLNCDSKRDGHAVVELMNAAGNVVATSVPVVGNGVRLYAEWTNPNAVRESVNQPVQFRIRLKNARLYAFAVEP